MLYMVQYGYDSGARYFRKMYAESAAQAEVDFVAWARASSAWADIGHRAFVRDEDGRIVSEFTFATN